MDNVQQVPIWLLIALNVAPLVVAVVLVWWRLQHQTVTNSVKFAFELREYFDEDRMKEHRARLAQKLRTAQHLEPLDDDVLAFFDAVGYNVKRRAVDERAVWNHLGWEVLRYWCALKRAGEIERLREICNDRSLYDNFDLLYERVVNIELTNRRKTNLEEVKPSDKDITQFLEYETNVAGLTMQPVG